MSRYIGQALRRKEDIRFITGTGHYVADIKLEGTLHMAVLRSSHAHARIENIDVSEVGSIPGVARVVSFKDLGAVGKPLPPLPMIVPHPALTPAMPYPLAKEKVHYVGEPVAAVVASDRYAAEDALEAIIVEYAPLPAVVDARGDALRENAPLIHEHIGSNCAAQVEEAVGDADQAFSEADVVVRSTFRIGRCSSQSMETRGILAVPDPLGNLTVWYSTQSPHTARRFIAEYLGMSEDQVRVIAPDIGGGFGAKNRIYPEEILVPWLATQLNQPVEWIGDRMEDFMSTYQEREQWHAAEMALRSDGTILGVRDRYVADNGAFSPAGIIAPLTTALTIPGPYKVPNYSAHMTCVYTNKVPVAPYRGTGRPQGMFVMERLLDLAAEKLGIDKVDLRLRNLIPPEEMPYDVGLHSRDGRRMIYESGDYPRAARMALDMIGYEAFRKEQEAQRKRGRYLGIGVANMVEMAGLGAFEGARVKVDPVSGKVTVSTGASSQGQSHETTLAQVCAERLGVSFDDVTVVGGDTSAIPYGIGTYASRVALAGGNAVSGAALKVREKALQLAAIYLEAAPGDLEITDGLVHVKGSLQANVSLQELAMIAAGPNSKNVTIAGGASPANALVSDKRKLPEDFQAGLEEVFYYSPSALSYANGTHAAIVEVDPETGLVDVLRYVIVHDCGTVLNPMVVEGQIRGGVAQGLGNALYEEVIYDQDGQPLTSSYMDYLLPTSTEVPDIELGHMESPNPNNPEGIKGIGEGGTVPGPAVINSAIDDALSPFGVYTTETPLSPSKVHSLLKEAKLTEVSDI